MTVVNVMRYKERRKLANTEGKPNLDMLTKERILLFFLGKPKINPTCVCVCVCAASNVQKIEMTRNGRTIEQSTHTHKRKVNNFTCDISLGKVFRYKKEEEEDRDQSQDCLQTLKPDYQNI